MSTPRLPHLPAQVHCAYIGVDEAPETCERCGEHRASACVGWEPADSTAFGSVEVCAPCLPAAVEHAIADTYLDADVTVDYFTYPAILDRRAAA